LVDVFLKLTGEHAQTGFGVAVKVAVGACPFVWIEIRNNNPNNSDVLFFIL
jgi:hypothetical protein